MPKRLPVKPKRGQHIGGNGVIYARYSSHNQKDLSIEQQVALDRQLADEHGIEILEVYADRAMSGTNDQRPQFQRMMKDAEKGHISFVIAWKSSRIGRNMLEAMMNEVRLNELGVRILYVEEDFDDTAAGRFAARSMMNVNQFYSENMAEDIRRGLQSNAERCMITGSIPFGYRSEDTRYALDEAQAPIVLEIFERVAKYEPLVQIADDLNARGIKTKSGGAWNKGSFHRMLANERYRGVYIYGDIRIEGGIPRIVSDELFYRVQEAVKMKIHKRKSRSEDTFLLTGKLFCGECGAYMTGTSGTGKSGSVHHYYACANQRNGDCTKKPVRKKEIEETIAWAVRNYVLQPDIISWIADGVIKLQQSPEYNAELKLLQAQLDTTTKSIKNIMTAIEQGIFTPTTKERLTELESEQSRTKASIALLKSERTIVTRDHVIAWLESFRIGDIRNREYQAKIIDTFLVAAYLYDDGRIKIVFDLPEGKRREIFIAGDKVFDESGNELRCSDKLSSPPPLGSYANPAIFEMYENGVFVLTIFDISKGAIR